MTTSKVVPKVVTELLERSNRLGSEPRFTNYAGGNTSAKGSVPNPATGHETTVMWVKGSGGDLGTMTESGLAALELDKFNDLKNVYRGVEFEDEMVALFDYCRFGTSGAAPSIDTAMHGLVPFDHVDHLHPDSIIALATSIDGEKLTRECFGDEILWLIGAVLDSSLDSIWRRLQLKTQRLRGASSVAMG